MRDSGGVSVLSLSITRARILGGNLCRLAWLLGVEKYEEGIR